MTFNFRNEDAPPLGDQIINRAIEANLTATREGTFVDILNPVPDTRYIVRGYSPVTRNEFTGAIQEIMVHEVHIDLYHINRELDNYPEVINRKGYVLVFDKFHDDRVYLLRKENKYNLAYVYTIDKVTQYQLDHVRPHQISELEPSNDYDQKELRAETQHLLDIGEVPFADSFNGAPVHTMLQKAKLNGTFHPSPGDKSFRDGNYLCQAYNCSVCAHLNYKHLRLEEEGGRVGHSYILGEGAFTKRSRNRDELNWYKRDLMPMLEVMETTMSLASLQSLQDREYLQEWGKRLKARDNESSLEEPQPEPEKEPEEEEQGGGES